MEFQDHLLGWLNRFPCPAFSVKNNQILACNPGAEGLLITPGTDVRSLILTGLDAYETFQDGCLYLQLNLSSWGYGAAVTREGEYLLFLLDQAPEDPALRSLSLAARELRNPLSSMMIATDRIAHLTREDPALQEWLARLTRSLNQMHRLVDNMSDAGRNDLLSNSGLHEWNKLIHDIFEQIQSQLSCTGVSLTFQGLPEPVYGFCKVAQLERAILNMVSNAIKFMPQGGKILAKLTRHHNMLHLSIQDSGSGIAENIRDSLFHRYRRQPAIEDSRYGIGLGMVLIRSAAASHGGAVLIDSPNGKGARITLTLAIRQDASAFKEPIKALTAEDSRSILRELSDCLPWECYQK